MLVDSHCHLDRLRGLESEADVAAAIDAAKARGVDDILCISIDRDNVGRVVEIADTYPNVYASVGIHPLDVDEQLTCVEELCAWVDKSSKVIAIGETGLDYYYSKDQIERQQQSFVTHIQAAARTGRPLVVHTREAKADTLRLLREHSDPAVAGVMHCFTEDWEMAEAALDLGFYISISGIVTFKNADQVRDVASKVPIERLLVETDSPYLAPIPYRGKPNVPAYVREVAEFVAALRGMPVDEFAAQTTANFRRLFRF